MKIQPEEFVALCNSFASKTLMGTLQIVYTHCEEGLLQATMPVNPSVHQPVGLLHGGATLALAESVGSAASLMFIDPEKQEARGIEVSCNHLKAKRAGIVTATAKIIHKGRSIHLWEVRVTDENNELISLIKITNMIMPRRG